MINYILISLFLIFPNILIAEILEGTPMYYNENTNNQQYTKIAENTYLGNKSNQQIISSREYLYKIPKNNYNNMLSGAITKNGVSIPNKLKTNLYAKYSRMFADFQFETGVRSILEWDDMLINELKFGINHDFSIRNFNLSGFVEYNIGEVSYGGLSMDYDLKSYSPKNPKDGIFTISIGDLSGGTNKIKFGLGAKHIWDLKGWKLSPSLGYEIFKHNLQMSNHIYPNPAIYLPLMTDKGDYVYGDNKGNYYTLPPDVKPNDNWYQVCLSPEDIKVVPAPSSGAFQLGNTITTIDYNPSMGNIPWGVGKGECVIIGGDGEIKIEGTTHIYNTSWSGLYLGLEIEKQVTFVDKLRFYLQLSMPNYLSEGIWPNRTDWQQNPSFIDKGNNESLSYLAEMEYLYNISDRIQLSLKTGTNYFQVGKIAGELYVAESSRYQTDSNGQYILDTNGLPILEKIEAHTEKITDSLLNAVWRSFHLEIGAKYAF